MDWKEIAGDVIAIAKKITPLVVPGAGPMIEAAEAVLHLGETIKPLVSGDQSETELTATLDELEKRVFAHADRTAANLRK